MLIAFNPRGSERIRTAVYGFADRCLATRPRNPFPYSGLQRYKIRTNSEALKILFQNDAHFFYVSSNRRIHFGQFHPRKIHHRNLIPNSLQNPVRYFFQ